MLKIQEICTKEIITKSKLPDADYVVNPYIGCTHRCIYCYAEFMKRFTNHSESWGEFLDIKRCSKKIKKSSLSGKTILISSVTDPYNRYETKYRATRDILHQLLDSDAKIEILTKSSLVLQDIDIIKKFKNIKIGISLNTLDDTFRALIEPFAPSIRERLKALKVLKEEGIETYSFISPIFPGLTDFKTIVDHIGDTVNNYCFENLNLRGGYKEKILKFISQYRPDLQALYFDIYVANNTSYWEKVKCDIENTFQNNNIKYKLYFYHDKIKKK
jgi:DNA repair photolyase